MSEPLLSPTFLFRFATPCYQYAPVSSDGSFELPERHRVTCFGELDRRRTFADLRAAWSPEGLAFSVSVGGKTKPSSEVLMVPTVP